MPITYKSVAASNLRAPDISKAGDLFDKAIGSFKSAGKGVQADRTAVAQGEANLQTADILEQIQGATNLRDAARLREQFSPANRDQNLLLDNDAITAGLAGLEDTITGNRRRQDAAFVESIAGSGVGESLANEPDLLAREQALRAVAQGQVATSGLERTPQQRQALVEAITGQFGGTEAAITKQQVAKVVEGPDAVDTYDPAFRQQAITAVGADKADAFIKQAQIAQVGQQAYDDRASAQTALIEGRAKAQVKQETDALNREIDRNTAVPVTEAVNWARTIVEEDSAFNIFGVEDQQKAVDDTAKVAAAAARDNVPRFVLEEAMAYGISGSDWDTGAFLDAYEDALLRYNDQNRGKSINIKSTLRAVRDMMPKKSIAESRITNSSFTPAPITNPAARKLLSDDTSIPGP